MSETLETVRAGSGQTVTMEAEVTANCPVDDTVDRYDVTAKIITRDKIVECESFRKYLDGFATMELTQEELVNTVEKDLSELLPDALVSVEAEGKHHGIDVRVRQR